MINQPSTLNTSYLYTGQQFDAATDLYSLRARYYSPDAGRFLSRDPMSLNIQNPMEINRYGYAANNPLTWGDPSGHGLFDQIKLSAMTLVTSVSVGLYNLAAWLRHHYETIVRLATEVGTEIAELLRTLNAPPGIIGEAVDDIVETIRVTVFHGTTSEQIAQDILSAFDPGQFEPDRRFGAGFYLAEDLATSAEELLRTDRVMTSALSYILEIPEDQVLDLTDEAIRLAYGYYEEDNYIMSQIIAQEAQTQGGVIAIRFPSFARPGGINWVILSDFARVLQSGQIIDISN